ncbi:MAG: bifunctional molybdenum cofactor biosynthesis protein MoaC/MoaB [Cytophagales bacterium]|nr:MAG: bifunctional molybdenum cofactor biosynthesis protein MoaC/MoaB [Cytophagales bacterium]
MVDITHKTPSLRIAIAQATLQVSEQATIEAIKNRKVPKGDVLEAARIAGLFAAKRTADMIPDCHPLPIEFTEIRFQISTLTIHIEVEIHTIYKTGVEVEAMHAASVVALTMYDMLKPLDKGISIEKISLKEKKGGKSDRIPAIQSTIEAAVIVCSDTIAKGMNEDRAGKQLIMQLEKMKVKVKDYVIIADEIAAIQAQVQHQVAQKRALVIFTGGTGLAPRDVTPEAIIPLLEKRVAGIEEAIRSYGQMRTPYAMLSRSVVGLIQQTLIMAVPGSTKGAEDAIKAVFPAVLHIFEVIEGKRHD